MELVLFDLDKTLLAGDSDLEWGKHLVEKGAVEREFFQKGLARFYADYVAGTLDIHAYMDFVLAPLVHIPRATLDAWHAEYLQHRILPLITAEARRTIEFHQQRQALTVVVTATNSFVTAPIAQALGVPHLVATQAETRNGQLTGRIVGVPCFREGKVARVEAFLAERNQDWRSFSATWCYSDSYNDLPLLTRVTHPVAVNPDARLLQHAKRHGWRIAHWRRAK